MEQLSIKKLSFHRQPIPIPADYRPLYKIGIIVLILRLCCRSETADLLKLHLFSWALTSEENLRKFQNYIVSDFQSEISVWGIEPALNRALLFAVAENICEVIDGKKYKLTEKGIRFYKMIDKESELFEIEKEFLKSIGKNTITDNRLKLISKQWTDAKN
jgi:hypothetical protein